MIDRKEQDIIGRWRAEYNGKPMVSIRCMTYNHENYIGQCLDGFLMQNTDFPFEVIVHDDASTDKTADIIRSYEKAFPNIIKPIYQTENQYSKKISVNKEFIIPKAKGKYLAACEGDDYWCNENKLQRQYDFLESNPEYVAVGHLTKCVDVEGRETKVFLDSKVGEYTVKENEKWQLFAHISSILHRNIFQGMSKELYDAYFSVGGAGDRVLPILLMHFGKLYVLPGYDSVYRYMSCPTCFMILDKHKSLYQRYVDISKIDQFAKIIGVKLDYSRIFRDIRQWALNAKVKKTDTESFGKIIRLSDHPTRDKIKAICYYPIFILSKIWEKIRSRKQKGTA